MRILLLTNEYPPYIYGGAGVHVEYLSQELSKLSNINIEVRSFHKQYFQSGRLTVNGITLGTETFQGCPKEFLSTLRAFKTCLHFNGNGINADITHCHTWYTHFGGILAKILYNTPLVITIHSLEPLRPWKREQIGHGYDLSLWVEKTAIEMADAIIAVSRSTQEDILRLFNVNRNKIFIIPNGIDSDEYQYTLDKTVLEKYNINQHKPYVLFVGRMTRQKGLYYLLQAIPEINQDIQVVLCAGESDTPALQNELEAIVKDLITNRQNVVWIPEMVSRETTIALYSQATVFCCPSIYEPFGIINLEAMACGTPVVGSKVGGIAEVVIDNVTGILVDPQLSPTMPHNPTNQQHFTANLAKAINKIALEPDLRARMSIAGRKRVEENYSWHSVAEQTAKLYENLLIKKDNNIVGLL